MSEQTATSVVATPVLPPPVDIVVLQRKCDCGNHTIAGGECESCKKGKESGDGNPLARVAANGSPVNAVPSIVHDVLNSPGQPLDNTTRHFFEQRFQHDFTQVRVHTDWRASQSAKAVNSLAYAVGRDVSFAEGQYRPHDTEGKRLLAHELAHVVQQRHVNTTGVQRRLRVSAENDQTEREADEVADRVLSSPAPVKSPALSTAPSSVSRVTIPTIQRKVTASFPTIEDNLTYGPLDWKIFDKEAHDVLEILKKLSDQDLKDTVAEMERKKLVDRFFDNLSDKDIKANQEALVRIKNARVYKEVTEKGGKKTTTTTTGSCSPGQLRRISEMLKQAIGWLTKAGTRLDAYLANPNQASNKPVLKALTDYFKNGTADVARYIRGQLSRFEADLNNRNIFTFECHEDWDLTCRNSGAYVPGTDREKVVFCPSFFSGDISDWDIQGFLHEIAHTQVGGEHIIDRAYGSNRMLRYLKTEEALTNAESYALLIRQIVSGKEPPTRAPEDTHEDCPADWKKDLDEAIARGQRWNRDAQVAVAKLTPEKAKKYSKDDIALMGGTTEKDVESLQKAFDKLADKLASGIDFECEPKGGGRCDNASTYWYAAGDLHICPKWKGLGRDEQVVHLLAGLYGYKADVDDNTRRFNYARFAQHHTKSAAPPLATILGNTAWTSDLLSIWFVPKTPTTAQTSYLESGNIHGRMSNDLPAYQVPPCYSRSLPFDGNVVFGVDRPTTIRPAPFTPPRVSMELRYPGSNGPITKAMSDPRADYDGAGTALSTKFEREFKFTFNRNGPFWMKFELNDPDTGVNRVYEDTVQVETERPCDLPDKPPKTRYA